MNIKKGDLVQIVRARACCGATESIGRTFVAGQVKAGILRCRHCGDESPSTYVMDDDAGERLGRNISRLIKIDPPAEGETREAYKELTA